MLKKLTMQLKQLKLNKSPGSDCIMNECFLECSDILSAHLCDVFNGIYVWTDGFIFPMHKIGAVNYQNNFKGITLVS